MSSDDRDGGADASYVPPPATSSLRVQPHVLDPFERQREFPLPAVCQILLYVLDVILVPLRLLFISTIFITICGICRILLIGATPAVKAGDPGFGPIRTWLIRNSIWLLGMPMCWSWGFLTSRVSAPTSRTDSGIMVSNHFGYCEIILLITTYSPSIVAKKEVADYPIMGTIARALQCIFVDRKDPADRERVMKLMVERGQCNDGRFPPLLLFPEGTTSNGNTLLRFQKGIFTAGVPIQSIAIKSHFMFFNAGWVNGSLIEHAFKLLSRVYHPLSIQELPLYTPNEEEKRDPILFSENVCQTMANALDVTVSEKTMYDNPELAALQALRLRRKQEALRAAAGDDNEVAPINDEPTADTAVASSANEGVPASSHRSPATCAVEPKEPASPRKQGWMEEAAVTTTSTGLSSPVHDVLPSPVKSNKSAGVCAAADHESDQPNTADQEPRSRNGRDSDSDSEPNAQSNLVRASA